MAHRGGGRLQGPLKLAELMQMAVRLLLLHLHRQILVALMEDGRLNRRLVVARQNMRVDEHEESRESVEDDQHSPFVGYRQEVDALEGHEQRTARGYIEMFLQEIEPFDGA
ncbi:hypothetical protein WR25_00901 [Diploscapter pachys]|uniref:Uncharacterized protein n=1 Tax=Diploscapter pachys TaxID=2018661 RepID=A0A2A2KVT4_9BILA|nr:hypothetical protein WR25_00901 [Diploscapter pachys]